jgi:glycosyltransferase 2 family protein
MVGGTLVSFVFIYLTFRGTNFAALGSALDRSNYWALIPAVAILAVAIFVRAIRWRLLFSPAARPPTRAVTSAMLVGYLFNSILPARGGEAIRVLVLRQRAGTPKFEAFGTVVAERATDVLALLALLFAIAPAVPATPWMTNVLLVGSLLFLGIGIAFVALAVHGERPARLLLRPLTVLPRLSVERMNAAAKNLIRGLAVFRRPASALPVFAITVGSWLLIALASWICMWATGLRLGFTAAILVVVATNLAMILPSGPAGVGVFEAATLVALHPFGVRGASALSYALILHAVNVLPLIVAGYLALHGGMFLRRRRPNETAAGAGRQAVASPDYPASSAIDQHRESHSSSSGTGTPEYVQSGEPAA